MKFPIGVKNCLRPKMTNYAGRTWDFCTVILPNGETIHGHLDTTWSQYFYFEVDGKWRNAEIYQFEKGGQGLALVMDLTKGPFDPRSVRR
jgi:hypothetical protein